VHWTLRRKRLNFGKTDASRIQSASIYGDQDRCRRVTSSAESNRNMQTALDYFLSLLPFIWVTLFIVAALCCWVVNLVGAPGNWILIGITLLWLLVGPNQYAIEWPAIVGLTILAIIGEGLEFGASILGAKKLGATRLGAVLSVVGSMVGGLVGVIIAIPIPIIGWIISSILFACIGAMVGTMVGERIKGTENKKNLKIGTAAFAGRLIGTVGKLWLGSVMLAVALVALFVDLI
jgi:uncharacterized protein YqgC (DUF456 family)